MQPPAEPCPICQTPYTPTGHGAARKATCGAPACVQARHRQQLAQRTIDRRNARQPRTGTCSVCRQPFAPRNSKQVTCKAEACQRAQLQRAIDKQTERRKQK